MDRKTAATARMIGIAFLAASAAGGCKERHAGQGEGAPAEEARDRGAKAPVETKEKNYVGEIERLGKDGVDFLVVGIEAPSFSDLEKNEKLLAYWLNMAAIAGNDIMYLQNHRYALPIKAMLEDVYMASAEGDKEILEIRKNLLDYLKYVWINHGQYDHRSSIKFTPNSLTEPQLRKIVAHAMKRGAKLDFLKGATAGEKLEPLLPHIFDAGHEKRLTVTDPGVDIIAESFVNFYDPGMKAADLEAVGAEWKNRLNVRFAFQNGRVLPQVYSTDCACAGYLKRVVGYLEKAVPYAPDGEFKESLELLVKYYRTGDEELYRRHSVKWIGLRDEVEYVNGFIEQLKDPRGVIGNFEGMSAVTADSGIVDRIIEDSLFFEEKMPWPARYKRDKVEKATATIVEVLVGTGDMGPVPWGGFNLPNYDDIRKDYGSKNVILLNILNSYSRTDREKVIGEFYLEEYRPLMRKHADKARKMLIYLHEIVGHGSGKSDPGLKDDPRNLMGRNFSSLEECRADLVALYHVGDRKFVEYGLVDEAEAEDVALAAYVMYLTRHLIRIGSLSESLVTEAHDRASHLVYRHLVGGGVLGKPGEGAGDFGVELVEKDGMHFIKVTDLEKAVKAVGALLGAIQVAKSTADTAKQNLLFDDMKLDEELRKEIAERKKSLELATQRVMVYPRLSPVKDADGKVVDVEARNDEDLVAQQLRFSGINR